MVMAKKPASRTAKATPVFSIGDRVEIVNFGRGKITELRGPLGPGGAQVYRVIYRRKPKAGYIEVLGSQLRPAKIVQRRKPTGAKLPTAAKASDATETRPGG
jgi:hypothetical protein